MPSPIPATARPCSPSSSWAFLVLGGALSVEFKLDRRCGCTSCCGASLTPLLAFFLLRVLKATLIALQYKHKAEEGRFALD